MTDTLATTQETEAPDRFERLAEKKALIEADMRVTAAVAQVLIEHPDLDIEAPNPVASGALWHYVEPAHLLDADPAVRRAAALDWLRRHAKAVQLVARKVGVTGPIAKIDGDRFGVRVPVRVEGSHWTVDIKAHVPAELTCELVPTGETRTVPAQPERTEPVMERRCPPSIFAGITDDLDEVA